MINSNGATLTGVQHLQQKGNETGIPLDNFLRLKGDVANGSSRLQFSLNISNGRKAILQFPNTSKINEQGGIGRRAKRDFGMFGWLDHGANQCRFQTWVVPIVATKITTECITGIEERIAIFYQTGAPGITT